MKPSILMVRFAGITCLVCGLGFLVLSEIFGWNHSMVAMLVVLASCGIGAFLLLIVGFSDSWLAPSKRFSRRREREEAADKSLRVRRGRHKTEGVILGAAIFCLITIILGVWDLEMDAAVYTFAVLVLSFFGLLARDYATRKKDNKQ